MSVVVIGNFDGVHTGHASVIRRAVSEADALHTRVVALTFATHPKTFFDPAHPVPLLTDNAQKEALLARLRVSQTVFLPFDASFASQDASAFLDTLIKAYGCEVLVCGDNFRVGKGAACDVDGLRVLGAQKGLRVLCVPLEAPDGDAPVSSTRIRAAVSAGEMVDAARMLGHLYALRGTVEKGRQIGRTMSLPTANLSFGADRVLPRYGVYATYARTDTCLWRAVTNVGVNPTVTDDAKPVVETHLLSVVRGDGDAYLYGKTLTVGFVERLRDEKRFENLEKLQEQIRTDIQKCTSIFGRFDDENVLF